jgi:hypothetical protein
VRNPFKNEITVSSQQVLNMVVQKEAELLVARSQLQNAAQIVEQLQVRIAELEKQLPQPNAKTPLPHRTK